MTEGRPLDGLVVADLSRVLAGPTAAVMLADLGARVIKVERPVTGDDTRQWGPPWVSGGEAGSSSSGSSSSGRSSSYFESANRSKQSIALDFGDADDLRIARALADRADIVIENYRAGALERYGLDAVAVAERNPRVVYVSITGFGSGAGADLPGYDFLVQAVGGLMSITGQPDGAPTKVGVAVVDLLAAKDVVMGVLAALLHRERTGIGQHVEVNLLSSAVASLANQASAYLTTGTSPGLLGNHHPSIAPYGAFRCGDEQLAIAVGTERQWSALADVIGAPELAGDARFATNAARVENHAELVVELERRLATDDVDGWIERMGSAGIPVGKVNDVAEALALATELGLDPTADVGEGHPAQLRHPVRYSGFEPVEPVAPPALDADRAAVLEWLGLEQAR
jgi:crotonobetainyl-CoA:carnitine CoA-transferase CaiB-like acyl-CoA transferase